MSLYGPTFHFTPVDLCIIFQCNLFILLRHVLKKQNGFKMFQIIILDFFFFPNNNANPMPLIQMLKNISQLVNQGTFNLLF